MNSNKFLIILLFLILILRIIAGVCDSCSTREGYLYTNDSDTLVLPKDASTSDIIGINNIDDNNIDDNNIDDNNIDDYNINISELIKNRKEYSNELYNSHNNVSDTRTVYVYHYDMGIESATDDCREQELLNTLQDIESQLEEINEEELWYYK